MPVKVHGQAVDFAEEPASQHIIVQPGKTVKTSVSFRNKKDPTLAVIKLIPFTANQDGTIELKNADKGALKFTINNEGVNFNAPFLFHSKEVLKINISITIPQEAELKDHYYVIFLESQAQPAQEGSITARSQLALGSSFLISVTPDGSVPTNASIPLFNILPTTKWTIGNNTLNIVDSGIPIPVSMIIANKENYLVTEEGTIVLKPLIGRKKVIAIPKQIILASSQKPFNTHLNGFFIGPYTVTATLSLNSGSSISYANGSFFAIPLQFTIGIGIGIGIILFLRRFLNR